VPRSTHYIAHPPHPHTSPRAGPRALGIPSEYPDIECTPLGDLLRSAQRFNASRVGAGAAGKAAARERPPAAEEMTEQTTGSFLMESHMRELRHRISQCPKELQPALLAHMLQFLDAVKRSIPTPVSAAFTGVRAAPPDIAPAALERAWKAWYCRGLAAAGVVVGVGCLLTSTGADVSLVTTRFPSLKGGHG
jgi:hypothetical protein